MRAYVTAATIVIASSLLIGRTAVAQNLNVYGTASCFAGLVGEFTTSVNTVSSGNCPDAENSSIVWGGTFFAPSYILGLSRAPLPAGPGGSPVLLSFATEGASNPFAIGNLSLRTGFDGTRFSRAYLNLSLWFTGGAADAPTMSINDQLVISMDWEGTNEVELTAPAATLFGFGGYNYTFGIDGFDPTNSDCSGSRVTRFSEVQDFGATRSVAVCGRFTRVSSTATVVPEPSTFALVACVLLGLVGIGRGRTSRT